MKDNKINGKLMEEDNKINRKITDGQNVIYNRIKEKLQENNSGIIYNIKMVKQWKINQETKI